MGEPLMARVDCIACRGTGISKRRRCHQCTGRGWLWVSTTEGNALLEFLYEFMDPDLLTKEHRRDD